VDPVAVEIDPPQGWREVVYAKDQPEYLPLPTLRSADGRVVSRWSPTTEERAAIAGGADVYLTLHTFNQPLQPILMTVGGAPVEPVSLGELPWNIGKNALLWTPTPGRDTTDILG
jgi:hypothetical protein